MCGKCAYLVIFVVSTSIIKARRKQTKNIYVYNSAFPQGCLQAPEAPEFNSARLPQKTEKAPGLDSARPARETEETWDSVRKIEKTARLSREDKGNSTKPRKLKTWGSAPAPCFFPFFPRCCVHVWSTTKFNHPALALDDVCRSTWPQRKNLRKCEKPC